MGIRGVGNMSDGISFNSVCKDSQLSKPELCVNKSTDHVVHLNQGSELPKDDGNSLM